MLELSDEERGNVPNAIRAQGLLDQYHTEFDGVNAEYNSEREATHSEYIHALTQIGDIRQERLCVVSRKRDDRLVAALARYRAAVKAMEEADP